MIPKQNPKVGKNKIRGKEKPLNQKTVYQKNWKTEAAFKTMLKSSQNKKYHCKDEYDTQRQKG